MSKSQERNFKLYGDQVNKQIVMTIDNKNLMFGPKTSILSPDKQTYESCGSVGKMLQMGTKNSQVPCLTKQFKNDLKKIKISKQTKNNEKSQSNNLNPISSNHNEQDFKILNENQRLKEEIQLLKDQLVLAQTVGVNLSATTASNNKNYLLTQTNFNSDHKYQSMNKSHCTTNIDSHRMINSYHASPRNYNHKKIINNTQNCNIQDFNFDLDEIVRKRREILKKYLDSQNQFNLVSNMDKKQSKSLRQTFTQDHSPNKSLIEYKEPITTQGDLMQDNFQEDIQTIEFNIKDKDSNQYMQSPYSLSMTTCQLNIQEQPVTIEPVYTIKINKKVRSTSRVLKVNENIGNNQNTAINISQVKTYSQNDTNQPESIQEKAVISKNPEKQQNCQQSFLQHLSKDMFDSQFLSSSRLLSLQMNSPQNQILSEKKQLNNQDQNQDRFGIMMRLLSETPVKQKHIKIERSMYMSGIKSQDNSPDKKPSLKLIDKQDQLASRSQKKQKVQQSARSIKSLIQSNTQEDLRVIQEQRQLNIKPMSKPFIEKEALEISIQEVGDEPSFQIVPVKMLVDSFSKTLNESQIKCSDTQSIERSHNQRLPAIKLKIKSQILQKYINPNNSRTSKVVNQVSLKSTSKVQDSKDQRQNMSSSTLTNITRDLTPRQSFLSVGGNERSSRKGSIQVNSSRSQQKTIQSPMRLSSNQSSQRGFKTLTTNNESSQYMNLAKDWQKNMKKLDDKLDNYRETSAKRKKQREKSSKK
ncbi:UNKNOWN [Stylonychia lemnae]|uniref:Uncharacterized protein n=1 Tax=Stylonychia lemnae TaxID=5949 RepID=A0A078ABT2_STYLE|nr:UNKNOWN [Stylonychia lemnae]|eukprot:CDW79316.1 UNKNOWN [Stylonychia lemnae]